MGIINIFKMKCFYPPQILWNTDSSILVCKYRPERTGFKMYAENTQPQFTFLALLPCKELSFFVCVQYTVYYVMCTMSYVQCIVYSVLCTVYCVQGIVYRVLCTVYCVQCIVYSVWYTVYCVRCIVYSVLHVQCIVHSILYYVQGSEYMYIISLCTG